MLLVAVNSQALLLPAGAYVRDKLELFRSAAVDGHASIPTRVGADAEANSPAQFRRAGKRKGREPNEDSTGLRLIV